MRDEGCGNRILISVLRLREELELSKGSICDCRHGRWVLCTVDSGPRMGFWTAHGIPDRAWDSGPRMGFRNARPSVLQVVTVTQNQLSI